MTVAQDNAETGLPFRAEIAPRLVEGGTEFELTLVGTSDAARDFVGTEVVFLDQGDTEVGRSELLEMGDGLVQSQPLTADAPIAPGEHRWTAVFDAGEAEEADAEPPVLDFAVVVQPHTISLTVWDGPSAVEAGEPFSLTLGIKCPCGCDSRSWPFSVVDPSGREAASGLLGDEPWPGTDGLHYARVALKAPEAVGQHEWTITARAPDGPVPHAARTARFVLNAVPRPEFTMRIEAVDAVTGQPVDRAKVVVHPYRTFTDELGTATLRLPRGRFTVFVSGKQYFAFKAEGEVAGDTTIRAEMHVDREFSEADAWA